MEQLKRWADYVCMRAFSLPASLTTSEFQGAGRPKPRFSYPVRDPRGVDAVVKMHR
jgi:hypothetical protein